MNPTRRLPSLLLAVALAIATLAGSACGATDPADDDRPTDDEQARPRTWEYPDHVWTNGSGRPGVIALVFTDTDASGDGGDHVVEVIVDTRDAEGPVQPVAVTVAGPWDNEGDLEIFPVVSDFFPDCDSDDCTDETIVPAGEVARLRFRGSWPLGEAVQAVGVDFTEASALPDPGGRTEPGFTLTPRPADEVQIPGTGSGGSGD
jgi:hypothetical protein